VLGAAQFNAQALVNPLQARPACRLHARVQEIALLHRPQGPTIVRTPELYWTHGTIVSLWQQQK
jgi:hypothetical protein